MKNIEYTKMAYLYDKFYTNKDYSKEVDFIKHFTKTTECKILDAGCGTGNHAKYLKDMGYYIEGFDLSPDMISIANKKIENHFFVEDLLNYSSETKYDLIISFFAVFNHLKNYKQFKTALYNLKASLNKNGTIIIDLHNPQRNGQKIENIENATRIMQWRKCNLLKKEITKITYVVNNKEYKTKHFFKIFDLKKLQKIANQIGFKSLNFYENYNINSIASKTSKNIQMVLTI